MKFGFTIEDFFILKDELKLLACESEIINEVDGEFGKKYTVIGRLKSPDGRNPEMISVWQFDNLFGIFSKIPKFVTAYPSKNR